MNIVPELDAGAMLLKGEVTITSETTGEILHDALAAMGADLIVKALDDIDNLQKKAEPQNENLVTYAAKLDKAESKINFSMPAEILERKIRAFNPYPAMFFEYEGERFKVMAANRAEAKGKSGEILECGNDLIIATADGALQITQIQRQGKRTMSTDELLRGFSFTKGTIL